MAGMRAGRDDGRDECGLSEAEAASGYFHGFAWRAGDAVRRFLSRQIACHASVDSPRSGQPAAFRTGKAGGDSFPGMVSGNALWRPEGFGMDNWKHTILPAIVPVLVLVGLVVIEPDLGTAVEIFIIALAMLYVAGLNAEHIFGAGVAALPVIYCRIVRVLTSKRVTAFLNPTADLQGHGFQLMQSLIAVGSGGFTGVGLMESKQKLFYLPEAHTDFIFAVLCEG